MYKKWEKIFDHIILDVVTKKSPYKYNTICNNCGYISDTWYNSMKSCRLCKPRMRHKIDKWSFYELKLTWWEYMKIDISDFEKLRNHCWYKTKRHSVETRIDNKLVKIHRFLLEPNNSEVIDHINWDYLDNRKENLRKCTFKQNSYNITKVVWKVPYKWIYKRKGINSYVARVKYKWKVYRKESKDLIKLVKWYDKRSVELFWEYATTNKILWLI